MNEQAKTRVSSTPNPQSRLNPDANRWQLRSMMLQVASRPLLMGIVNVTPDSFSDRGKWKTTSEAVNHALDLIAAGADIIDVGGESTRPYSTPVNATAELERVIPVIRAIASQTAVPISIDTSKAIVAEQALEAGGQIINDVTGLEGDPEMVGVARNSGAGVCVMHMQGSPQTMQDNPTYQDVVCEVHAYLRRRKSLLIDAGIEPARICLDPGIGFGKTHAHNIELLSRIGELHDLNSPLLVGHSRKGFIGKVLGSADADRDAATLGISLWLATQGVQILRVHEVGHTRQALTAFASIRDNRLGEAI